MKELKAFKGLDYCYSPECSDDTTFVFGTVKNYAQIRLQVRQNKVCIGQDTALDIRTAKALARLLQSTW